MINKIIEYVKAKRRESQNIKQLKEQVPADELCRKKVEAVANELTKDYHGEKVDKKICEGVLNSGNPVTTFTSYSTTYKEETGLTSVEQGSNNLIANTSPREMSQLKLSLLKYTCGKCGVKKPLGDCLVNRPPVQKIFYETQNVNIRESK